MPVYGQFGGGGFQQQEDPFNQQLPMSPASRQMQAAPPLPGWATAGIPVPGQEFAVPTLPTRGPAAPNMAAPPPMQQQGMMREQGAPAAPNTVYPAAAATPNSTVQDFLRGQDVINQPNPANLDVAMRAIPGQAPPAGFVRSIAPGGDGRGVEGEHWLPAESVGPRRGISWAEITANNPTLGTQDLVSLRQRLIGQNANLELSNRAVGNETVNRNAGIMPNADAIAMGRNNLDQQRVNNEVWARTPEGRRAGMENAALQAYLGQPAGTNRRPLSEYIRDLGSAEQSGLLGGRAPSSAPSPASPAVPSMLPPDQQVPRPAAQTPAAGGGLPSGDTRYNAGPPATAYAPHQDMLNALRAGLPEGDRGIGSFIDRLNRNQPGFAGQNMPALEAYLRDQFGTGAFNDASSGVIASPFGFNTPMSSSAGLGANLSRLGSQVGSVLTGGLAGNREMTPEQSGRALLATYLRQQRGR